VQAANNDKHIQSFELRLSIVIGPRCATLLRHTAGRAMIAQVDFKLDGCVAVRDRLRVEIRPLDCSEM